VEKLDIGITKCLSQLGPELKEVADNVYLWIQGYNVQATERQIDSYDGVLLSQWQREYFVQSIPPFESFKTIFGNGIHPSQFSPITERENLCSCIYATNYALGLNALLAAIPPL